MNLADVRHPSRHVLEVAPEHFVVRHELIGESLNVIALIFSASSRMLTSAPLPVLNTSPNARGSFTSASSAETTSPPM